MNRWTKINIYLSQGDCGSFLSISFKLVIGYYGPNVGVGVFLELSMFMCTVATKGNNIIEMVCNCNQDRHQSNKGYQGLAFCVDLRFDAWAMAG